MLMVAVAVSAGVVAEVGQRRQRLVRLCIEQRSRADACFDEIGRICKNGESAASIEAYYRRQGPSAELGYHAALYHLALANEYDKAANRRYLPMLADLSPLHDVRDIRSLAEWGLEGLAELTPLFGIGVVLLVVRSNQRRQRAMGQV
jgi:hypothetical protein